MDDFALRKVRVRRPWVGGSALLPVIKNRQKLASIGPSASFNLVLSCLLSEHPIPLFTEER